MEVVNRKGSSKLWPKPICGCGTWINHWNYNSDYKLNGVCRGCGAVVGDKNLDGGHVVLANDRTGDVYIIPLCDDCNTPLNPKVFDIGSEQLIPAKATLCNPKYRPG